MIGNIDMEMCTCYDYDNDVKELRIKKKKNYTSPSDSALEQ